MAATTKKGGKTTKTKQRRPKLKTSGAEKAQTIAELRQQLAELANELQHCKQQLAEDLEQQTATSEILGVIASSPTNLQPVFETILADAVRLCESHNGVFFTFDGEVFHVGAGFNITGELDAYRRANPIRPGRESAVGRVGLERRLVHIPDVLADPEVDTYRLEVYRREGMRSVLAVPLLKEDTLIGTIAIHRKEVRPFTEKQITLLETFADQAVIAIENVRLFKELQERNRDLTEALEQQTATGEVLRVIASSPTNVQPVLDTLIANAVKLSGATKGHVRQLDGEFLRVVAHYGETAEEVALLQSRPGRVGVQTSTNRAFSERKAIQIADATAERGPSSIAAQHGARTLLSIPLLREGTAIGVIVIWRDIVEPFTERQVALVETFADQAVIAIENVRLFKELQERNRDLTEALEQQMATSEVLKVISRSTFDLYPVLETLIENATRLCGANQGYIYRSHDDVFRLAVAYNVPPELRDFFERTPISSNDRGTVMGRVALDRRPVHIPDASNDPEFTFKEVGARLGSPVRTLLGVPLLRAGQLLGGIVIRRSEIQPFTEKQIELVRTFADQAVIAIENVRLFKELQDRNRDLTETLEQQTATSEILGVIASSPTDIQPVLNVVAE